jgi:hypothetical protein
MKMKTLLCKNIKCPTNLSINTKSIREFSSSKPFRMEDVSSEVSSVSDLELPIQNVAEKKAEVEEKARNCMKQIDHKIKKSSDLSEALIRSTSERQNVLTQEQKTHLEYLKAAT